MKLSNISFLLIPLGLVLVARRAKGKSAKLKKGKETENKQDCTTNHGNKPLADSINGNCPVNALVTKPPSNSEEEWRKVQQKFWERQITIAKWLNGITLLAGIVGAIGLVVLYETLQTTQRAVDAAVTQAFAAVRGINLTRQALQLDQRAWVGTPKIEHNPTEISLGLQTTFKIIVNNTGKTPALNVRVRSGSQSVADGKTLNIRYDQPIYTVKSTTIFPGSAVVILAVLGKMTQGQINLLNSSQHTIYLFGEIAYDDVFKQGHRTTFCRFLSNDLKGMINCPTHNDAD